MVGGNWLKSIFSILDHLPGFPNYTFLNFQQKFFSLHPILSLICRAMLCYAYCAIISQLYVILCLLSYGAHWGLLCLLIHDKPTVCHTMPTRVPCYAYKVILKLQHLLWHTMLTNVMPIFHSKPPVCHNLPTKV